MKIRYIILFIVLSTSLLIAGDNILEYFTAKSDGKSITLEWKTLNETQFKFFEIERSASNLVFSKIATVDPKGSNSMYNYSDENVYYKQGDNPTPLSNSIYIYRIKIVKNDDSYNYTNNVPVTHNVSSFRRTWGMIKEMFR